MRQSLLECNLNIKKVSSLMSNSDVLINFIVWNLIFSIIKQCTKAFFGCSRFLLGEYRALFQTH